MINIAVFASGRGSNFEAIIKYFKNSKSVNIACLVCDQKNAYAIEIAKKNNIETKIIECLKYKTKLEIVQEQQIVDYLIQNNVDLIVLAGYMRIIKEILLKSFINRIVNIHPSILPSFKGLDAVKQAFDYGVKVTGVTVHLVDEQIDHGKILDQRHVYVDNNETFETLLKKVHKEEQEIYPMVIEKLAEDIQKQKGN